MIVVRVAIVPGGTGSCPDGCSPRTVQLVPNDTRHFSILNSKSVGVVSLHCCLFKLI